MSNWLEAGVAEVDVVEDEDGVTRRRFEPLLLLLPLCLTTLPAELTINPSLSTFVKQNKAFN